MSILRMSLGGKNDEVHSTVVSGKITNRARYFADFESYLVALHGFALVAEASNRGTASNYRASDVVALGCKQSPEQWLWAPAPTVALLALNHSPQELSLERRGCSLPPAGATLNLGALDTLLYTFGQALATNYFERHIPHVKTKYGDAPNGWPDVWNFGRVVRNAMSHGGKITFASLNAQPVQWRSLNYSPANNGLRILHTDLWPGDLFNLIQDMDAAM